MSEEAVFTFHMDGDTSNPKVYGVYKKLTATGTEWRVVGPLAKTIHRMLAEITRERDEARAEAERLKQSEILGREVLLPVKREQSLRVAQEAEKLGFERGIQGAVAAGDKMAEGGTYGWVWLRAAILALLDKPSLSPEDKLG
jgi:hypothetical protein